VTALDVGLPILAVAGTGLACATSAYLVTTNEEVLRHTTVYVGALDADLRWVAAAIEASTVLRAQIAIVLAMLVGGVMTHSPWCLLVGAGAWVGPRLLLRTLRKRRAEGVERQLVSFLQALANALKSTPSVNNALVSVREVLRGAVRDEVDVCLNQIRLGATFDEALLNMARRLEREKVDAVVTVLLVGWQVGGNLPKVLEATSVNLREMDRLEGVTRSKTAEGKVQLGALGLAPFLICGGLEWASPGFFSPLQGNPVGYLVTSVAALLWVAAMVMAHRILAVDL